MICLYGASAISQQFLKIASPETLVPFAITTVFTSLSILPLALSPVMGPKLEEVSSLTIKKLFIISSTGVCACFLGGCLQGMLMTMAPVFIEALGFNHAFIADFMFFILFGAMSLQYPIGHLSDTYDRRTVLFFVSLLSIFTSFGSLALLNFNTAILILAFFIGGLTYSVYSLSISHTIDFTEPHQIVGATQGLLLIYSAGAASAPILVTIFSYLFGPKGFFYYLGIISIIIAIISLFRTLRPGKEISSQHEPFVPTPTSSPIILELDPRGESEEDN